MKDLNFHGHEEETWTAPVSFVFICLGGYFALHIGLRLLKPWALELDEAEQLIFSQWLLPGYSSQPPLYTWLQIPFIKFLGKSVLAISLLKNLLLFLMYLFIFLSADILYKNKNMAALATVSILFIPQISWGAERDLTHSVLVLTTEAITLYTSLRLINRPALRTYAGLGLCLGLGFLSKANFILFAIPLFLALLTTNKGRNALIHINAVILPIMILLVTLPYLLWAFSNTHLLLYSLHKLRPSDQANTLETLLGLGLSTVLIIGPVSLISAVLLKNSIKRWIPPTRTTLTFPFCRYFVILGLTLVCFVLIFHATKFKNRWLAPLIFMWPLCLFQCMAPLSINKQMVKRFLIAVASAAILISLIMFSRKTIAPRYGYFVDLSFPSQAIARQARILGFRRGLIISDKCVYAANLLMQFQDSTALYTGLNFLPQIHKKNCHQALILWQQNGSKKIPNDLRSYLEDKLDISLNACDIIEMEIPYDKAGGYSAKIAMVLIQNPYHLSYLGQNPGDGIK